MEWMKLCSSIWQMGRERQKNFTGKACGLSHNHFKNFKPPFNISGMDEATLFKFGKCIDYGKSHTLGKNSPETGVVWVT